MHTIKGLASLEKDRVTAVLRNMVDDAERAALFVTIGHLDYAEAKCAYDGIVQALGDARP